jgi:hypothetical protein
MDANALPILGSVRCVAFAVLVDKALVLKVLPRRINCEFTGFQVLLGCQCPFYGYGRALNLHTLYTMFSDILRHLWCLSPHAGVRPNLC